MVDENLQSGLSGAAAARPHQCQQIDLQRLDCNAVYLLQPVEHPARLRAPLQLNHDAHPAPVGLVAQVA